MSPSSSLDRYSPIHYAQWSKLWTPIYPTQSGLLLVRYPTELSQLTRADYEQLIKLRLIWLMGDWADQTAASQNQTHSLLLAGLTALDPIQEPPQLSDLWQWQQDWADALVQYNLTLLEKLAMQMQQNFPLPIPLPNRSEQDALRPLHNEMTLYDWLSELTDGRI